MQVGKGARFARLASSRSSEIASPERRKWNQNNKTGTDRNWAENHFGRQLLGTDAAVTGVRLPFGSV